jgi:cytochrome P450
MAEKVQELDLPVLWDGGMGVFDPSAVRALTDEQWLAKTRIGYVVTRYDDVCAVLRDRRFYSASSRRPDVQTGDENLHTSLLELDGDEHTRLRRLVSRAFTPRAADRLRPHMQATFEALLTPALARGSSEAVRELCTPYPIPVICQLLGAPKEDTKLFSSWADDINRMFDVDPTPYLESIRQASREIDDYIGTMIAERRKQPADDLLSELIATEEQDDHLSTDELTNLVQLILLAGTDTTRNQLACSIGVLMAHPDQWKILVERPDLVPRAVEETMRYVATLRGALRFASEDIVYRDVLFPKGTMVWTSTAMANRDPAAWTDPDVFDITIDRPAQQMAFGMGVHFCLGASLARAELQEALRMLVQRAPAMTAGGALDWKPDSVGIWGPVEVPLRFR